MSIKNVRDISIIAFIVYAFSQSWYVRHNPDQLGYWLANVEIAKISILDEYYWDVENAD